MPKTLRHVLLLILSRQQSLRFAPSEKFEYSNSGYVLQGQIIERVTDDHAHIRLGDLYAAVGRAADAAREHRDGLATNPKRLACAYRTARASK
jgi:hypothetical protein